MIFETTELAGAFIIKQEKHEDERGFFARVWCAKEFEQHGLVSEACQESISQNVRKGTLRGMHYQVGEFQETKLVRCTRGAFYDVIVDLRTDSATYLKWIGVELTEGNGTMLYIPRGFAHGFITLRDNTLANYVMSQFYSPEHARGARYDDPAFGIKWPAPVEVISDRDRNWPDFAG